MDSWSEETDGEQPGFDSFDDANSNLEDDTLDLSGDEDDFTEDLGIDEDDPTDADPDDTLDQDDPDPSDPVEEDTPPFDVVDEEQPGSDPDAVPYGEDAAFEPQFPPDIDVDPLPDPVDGAPWSDAALLGDVTDVGGWNSLDYAPVAEDLFTMDGSTGGDWSTLLASPDPSVSSLARWWQP